MIDIKKEYAEEIARISAAADANRDEAIQNRRKNMADLEQHQTELNNLVNASITALSQFSTACKKLKKLGRTTEPDPEFVMSTAEVFIEYGNIAKQLPEARETVKTAEDNLEVAKQEEQKAYDDLSHISYFLS